MNRCQVIKNEHSYRLLYNYHGKPELSKTLTCNLESGKWKSDEGRDTEISAEDEIVVGCEVIGTGISNHSLEDGCFFCVSNRNACIWQ